MQTSLIPRLPESLEGPGDEAKLRTQVLEGVDEEFLVSHYQDTQSLALLCKDLIPACNQ